MWHTWTILQHGGPDHLELWLNDHPPGPNRRWWESPGFEAGRELAGRAASRWGPGLFVGDLSINPAGSDEAGVGQEPVVECGEAGGEGLPGTVVEKRVRPTAFPPPFHYLSIAFP